MLVIFNLGWDRFNIDGQVSGANRRLNGLARERNAGHFMIFNFASLGAGERITDREERIRKARLKDSDFDKKVSALRVTRDDNDTGSDQPVTYQKPDQQTIDFLRYYHQQLKQKLNRDDQFQAYHDVAEMLASLKAEGHNLAAIFTGSSKDAQKELKDARILDYFEDNVFGYDSIKNGNGDPTSIGLYQQALRDAKVPSYESIIVSDHRDGIVEGRAVKPMAAIGYLDPYLDKKKREVRLKQMRDAGAAFAVVGGHGVASLPALLLGNRGLKGVHEAADRRYGSDSAPGISFA